MKRLIMLVFVFTLAIMLVGCQTLSTASHLDEIKKAGKIVVGTSADYDPYEFVDETGTITGFDVELMTEIAKRMGMQLEWTDMPFDSLIAAVQENKIDMSIACFNYSEERDAEVDFSDVYFTSEDAFVVAGDFSGTIADPEDVANYIVGVQSGTVQDEWLTSTLVDTGKMAEANLMRYERVDQAALDLQAGRIQVFMADSAPAQVIVEQFAGFQIPYRGVLSTSGDLNIVLREGDAELQAEVNRIIQELQAEGFIEALAVKYFSE